MPSIADLIEDGSGVSVQEAPAYIEGQIPAVEIVGIMLNQRPDKAGGLYDVMDIGFTIPPSRASFTPTPTRTKTGSSWPSTK